MTPLPSSHRARSKRMPMAEINVTPMVDVMLVLLIIFMVTAPLLVAGVPVDLPDANAKALAQDQAPVAVSIMADGRIFVDEDEVASADLPVRFAALAMRGGETGPQIQLRADQALGYGRVMAVMAALNAAGLNKVALVTSGDGAPQQ